VTDAPGEALSRPFRPFRARRVAITFAVAQAVVLLGLAVLTPGDGAIPWHWYDRLGVVLLAGAIAYVLLLFARLRATPGPDGLVVRNVVRVTELEWAQIVAVMAIQRADGERGVAEARRLATLVAARSRTDTDD
jgi:hypothetical protein